VSLFELMKSAKGMKCERQRALLIVLAPVGIWPSVAGVNGNIIRIVTSPVRVRRLRNAQLSNQSPVASALAEHRDHSQPSVGNLQGTCVIWWC
jgi:hypothetical protein